MKARTIEDASLRWTWDAENHYRWLIHFDNPEMAEEERAQALRANKIAMFSVRENELRYPLYYGEDNRIKMKEWLLLNIEGACHIFSNGVGFQDESDAMMCYLAFR